LRELKVFIEIKGREFLVGHIVGEDYKDAVFQYDMEYLNNSDSRAISVAFPLREEAFTPEETKNFFEGLLPEGFSRRAVAEWIKTDEKDYLTILGELGKECLGALKVIEGDNEDAASYDKVSLEELRQLAAEGATKSTKIGNTDSHIKNYSVLYNETLDTLRLAPAYDLVATRVYGTTGEMSFYFGDEININNINRATFGQVAREVGLAETFVYNIFNGVADKLETAFSTAVEELEDVGFKEASEMRKKVLETGGYTFIH